MRVTTSDSRSFREIISLAARVLRDDGPRALWHRSKRFLSKRYLGRGRILLPVAIQDIVDASFKGPEPSTPRASLRPTRPTINWVVPPAGLSSGGHGTIFRFVRDLQERGYRNR